MHSTIFQPPSLIVLQVVPSFPTCASCVFHHFCNHQYSLHQSVPNSCNNAAPDYWDEYYAAADGDACLASVLIHAVMLFVEIFINLCVVTVYRDTTICQNLNAHPTA